MKQKRVGIYSGTFDPVHLGHLQFAEDALNNAQLDKIFFLVEPRPRRKQGVRAYEHRLKMVQVAVKNHSKFGVIVLEKQVRFTPHETLPPLLARFKGAQLFILMGDDMLRHLEDWPHVEDLITASHFIIGVRHKEKDALKYIHTLEKTRGLKLQYEIFPSSLPGVSSSQVKAVLRKTVFSEYVLPEVQAYIQKHGLYSKTDS